MMIKDGQVMDYTKSTGPYTDERSLPSTATPVEPPLAPSIVATMNHIVNFIPSAPSLSPQVEESNMQHFEPFIPPPELQTQLAQAIVFNKGLSDDAALDEAPEPRNIVTQAQLPPVSGSAPNWGNSSPKTPSRVETIRRKIEGRQEALMDMQLTPEVEAQIKLLNWVMKVVESV